MRAQDLRIGNLVMFGGVLMTIDGINYYDEELVSVSGVERQHVDGAYGINNIDAIEITEEWLLKFGFNKGKKGWYKTLRNKSKFNLYMFTANSIHHLQNLYYALTGEELILKN